ncbi:proline utilization trans-activator [Microdochium nivale]|nr:proline utilization trans-activator [Microdochium nivale]
MDASSVFRQVEGFGIFPPRGTPQQSHQIPLPQHRFKNTSNSPHADEHDDAESPNRIAHTLTACCRCRQRKTRCDPALPRCLPCERSGSVCEYFDTTKGKKISRYYVVRLQEKVRALEADLGQFVDEEELPRSHEDFVGPGGLVRLNDSDETPRYLGPSSGIAMVRILMEEAKRYTDSKRISELIPEVKNKRYPDGRAAETVAPRSRSFVATQLAQRRKSYPILSAVPASTLPSRPIANRLVEVFQQRAQIFTPALHEESLAKMTDNVFAGSKDPFQNFVVRLVIAISMQKLDAQYAGLADSYYLAAIGYFEDVVRPKDLKTLQCLVLVGQYSLLTPTRTAVYYVIGLATKICQQLGFADEKTIALGAGDPLTLDMRRRVSWSVRTMEYGLSQSMGRPCGFAKTDDNVDVKYFDVAKDVNITEKGILPGPPDVKKIIAIHFCKMRELQAEIRRVLYSKKPSGPKDDGHPWFREFEERMSRWLEASPTDPVWCKAWFSGRLHTMVVTMHRPTPQCPRPSIRSAAKCFDSSAYVIDISSKQMMGAAVDITWVFLLTLYMALNALLWSVTYPDVRQSHDRDEVQNLVNIALDIIDQCADRWPGTAAASQLYSTLAKATLESYNSHETPTMSPYNAFETPPHLSDPYSPPPTDPKRNGGANSNQPLFNPPQFGQVFNTIPEQITDFGFHGNGFGQQQHPTFRSNSIFHNPASSESNGRRFSYFPPDFNQMAADPAVDDRLSPITDVTVSPPLQSPAQQHLPNPQESMTTGSSSIMNTPLHDSRMMASPNMNQPPISAMAKNTMPPPQQHQRQPQNFTIPPMPPHHRPQGQQPLPQATTVTDWFSPPPPFITPYAAFGGATTGLWGGPGSSPQSIFQGHGGPQFHGLPPERQGSLSQEQQAELMDVLENEGLTDIEAYLSLGFNGFTGNGDAPQNMVWTS